MQVSNINCSDKVTDINGNLHTFDELMGENGLIIFSLPVFSTYEKQNTNNFLIRKYFDKKNSFQKFGVNLVFLTSEKVSCNNINDTSHVYLISNNWFQDRNLLGHVGLLLRRVLIFNSEGNLERTYGKINPEYIIDQLLNDLSYHDFDQTVEQTNKIETES